MCLGGSWQPLWAALHACFDWPNFTVCPGITTLNGNTKIKQQAPRAGARCSTPSRPAASQAAWLHLEGFLWVVKPQRPHRLLRRLRCRLLLGCFRELWGRLPHHLLHCLCNLFHAQGGGLWLLLCRAGVVQTARQGAPGARRRLPEHDVAQHDCWISCVLELLLCSSNV